MLERNVLSSTIVTAPVETDPKNCSQLKSQKRIFRNGRKQTKNLKQIVMEKLQQLNELYTEIDKE